MEQYRILTLNAIAAAGLRRFPDDRYVVGNDVDAPHAMLVRSRDLHGVAIPPTVRAISLAMLLTRARGCHSGNSIRVMSWIVTTRRARFTEWVNT